MITGMKKMNKKNLLEEIFPVGTIQIILRNFEENIEIQISKNIEKLNDMIGNWEYYGITLPAIYFIRKK